MIRVLFTVLLLAGPVVAAAQPPGLDEIRLLLRENRLEEASAAIEARLAADPSDRHSRFLKGVVLAERQDADGAIAVFEALSRDFPELPEPYNNLAVLYAGRGDFERARDALLQAINTHPSYATAHENLGDIYAKMAGLAYGRALSLDTDNEAAKNKLALIDDIFTRAGPGPGPRPASAPAAESAATTIAAPAPQLAPMPVTATSGNAGGEQGEPGDDSVIEVIRSWASAWSSQDVEAYLSHYAARRSPEPGLSRTAWEARRRERLSRPAAIRVEVDNFQVRIQGEGEVDVTFEQRYQSDTYRDRVRKLLSLERIDGRWKITGEQTLSTL